MLALPACDARRIYSGIKDPELLFPILSVLICARGYGGEGKYAAEMCAPRNTKWKTKKMKREKKRRETTQLNYTPTHTEIERRNEQRARAERGERQKRAESLRNLTLHFCVSYFCYYRQYKLFPVKSSKTRQWLHGLQRVTWVLFLRSTRRSTSRMCPREISARITSQRVPDSQ